MNSGHRPGSRSTGWRVYLPRQEWDELGGRRRRQVARHARRGRRHPDPSVAAVAHAWALQMPQPERPSSRRARLRAAASWLPTLVLVAVAVVLQLDTGGSTGVEDWRERRLARRILALPPA